MESKLHIDLVGSIIAYVKKIIPEDNYDLIQSDSNGSSCDVRIIGNFIPDVYYRDSDQLIIGEAKTLKDFDKMHSREQFAAYLSELKTFDGSVQLVIAVPWQLTVTAKNYFRRKKTNNNLNLTIIILNEMGRKLII